LGNAHSAPLAIACAELAKAGPGGNGHITITDFHACTDLIVVSRGDGKTLSHSPSRPNFLLN
jgi:hypothetical protein